VRAFGKQVNSFAAASEALEVPQEMLGGVSTQTAGAKKIDRGLGQYDFMMASPLARAGNSAGFRVG